MFRRPRSAIIVISKMNSSRVILRCEWTSLHLYDSTTIVSNQIKPFEQVELLKQVPSGMNLQTPAPNLQTSAEHRFRRQSAAHLRAVALQFLSRKL